MTLTVMEVATDGIPKAVIIGGVVSDWAAEPCTVIVVFALILLIVHVVAVLVSQPVHVIVELCDVAVKTTGVVLIIFPEVQVKGCVIPSHVQLFSPSTFPVIPTVPLALPRKFTVTL